MKQRCGVLAHYASDLFDRKEDSRFVISKHDRNQRGIGTQSSTQAVEIKFTIGVDIQPRDLVVVLL